jgi:GntR family transcriptional regulator
MDPLFKENIIDKTSAIPLYHQLYLFIEGLIKDGKLKEGDKLPPEEELVAVLGISRPTIRQAYKELSTKGFVFRQRSKGTVVTKPKVFDKFLSKLTTYRDEIGEDGNAKTKVIALEVTEDKEAGEILREFKQIRLVRLRFREEIPVVLIETYLSYERCKELLSCNFESNSLYESMEKIGCPIKRVTRSLKATRPNEDAIKYLEIEADEPVMLSKTKGFGDGELPLEYSIASYYGGYAEFQIELTI